MAVPIELRTNLHPEVTDVSNQDHKSSAAPRRDTDPRPPLDHAFTTVAAMRNFWALPAVLRIALASQHAFSVFDDLLAFPQVWCAQRWPVAFVC
jgi:hypothetical protein